MSRIRVGVVGLKHGMASVREVLFQEGYELVALCSRSRDTYEYLCGKEMPAVVESVTFTTPRDQLIRECRQVLDFHEVAFYTDYDKFLEHDGMEAVILAVPIPLNAEFAGRALAAKKHVLAAKPFALTLEQGLALKEMVARATTKFMVNYEFRHSPFIQAIHGQIKAGAIGKLQLMWWNMFRMPFRGVYALRESSGGALVAEVCHWFDLFHLFNSWEPFSRICAFGGLDVLGKQQKIEDNAVCIIEYANGVRGSINFTYFTNQPEHNTFGLVGDRGKISGNTEKAGSYILYNGPEQNKTVVTMNPHLAHQGHLGFDVSHRRLLEAIREDLDVNEHEAEIGFESLLISLAAQRSIDTGAIVTREEMLR